MQQDKYSGVMLAMVALVSTTLAGCSPQQQATLENSAEEAGNAVENTVERVEDQAGPAVEEAKDDLSDGGLTLKVKTALSASDKVEASRIDVDTKNRVVYLRGDVADDEQRAVAESLARNTVGANVQVVNELKIQASAEQATPAKPETN